MCKGLRRFCRLYRLDDFFPVLGVQRITPSCQRFMATSTTACDRETVWNPTSADPVSLGVSQQGLVSHHWPTVSPSHLLYVLLPILTLTALTALIRCFDLDIRVNRLFFDANAGEFPALHARPSLVAYHYGPLPGLLLGIGAAAMFVASFVWTRCRPFRAGAAFLALLLAIGPGLIVNGLLKSSWNRPRPCDLTEFGGGMDFVQVLDFGVASEHVHKSFPSGHASMGFYLLAPIFILPRNRWRWSITFLLLGLSLGFVIGIGRIAQGRHFPSDVLWSGAIVYFTGLVLAYILLPKKAMLLATNLDGQILLEEPLIFHIDDYRETTEGDESDVSKVPVRRISNRRAA